MHLGRVPARLHEDLVDRVAELGPSAAWRRAVELALDERVDGVLLAGDLVDGGNDFFEAFAHLRDGVRRLTEHGVQVVAVAGNHDPEGLARLVQVVPEVRLDRKSTRLNSSHVRISYAVFCLKKKKNH